jgi:hypothetical protein
MSEVINEGEVGAEPTELSRAIAKSLQDGLRDFFGVESTVAFLGQSLGQLEFGL